MKWPFAFEPGTSCDAPNGWTDMCASYCFLLLPTSSYSLSTGHPLAACCGCCGFFRYVPSVRSSFICFLLVVDSTSAWSTGRCWWRRRSALVPVEEADVALVWRFFGSWPTCELPTASYLFLLLPPCFLLLPTSSYSLSTEHPLAACCGFCCGSFRLTHFQRPPPCFCRRRELAARARPLRLARVRSKTRPNRSR
jgi:bacterioferritin-associated ferredoxin